MRAVILALFAVVPAAVAAPSKQSQPTAEAGPSEDAAPDAADAPDLAPGTARPPAVHREGDYGGVRPGRAAAGDGSRRSKQPRKGTLSWIGFEAKDGSAEVFLQSVASFEMTQRVENSTLIVNLTGVSQLGQNTWRHIDTRFFDSPISRIVAKRGRGAGLEIRIEFKTKSAAREATARTSTEPDGMYYAYLSFAAS